MTEIKDGQASDLDRSETGDDLEGILRSVGKSLPQVLYVFDLVSLRTLYWNRPIAAELGYSPEQSERYKTREIDALLHPEDRARLPALLERWKQVKDGEVLETEYRLKHVDGSWRWFLSRDQVLARDGERRAIRTVGMLTEVTRRKELEAQLKIQERLEALGRMAGGVAHDFNNYLTAILCSAKLIETHSDATEGLRGLAREVRQGVESAAELTEQLLAFSQNRTREREGADLVTVVDTTLGLVKRLLPESIRVYREAGISAMPVAMPGSELQQVLMNLVLNARDAMPDGGDLRISFDRVVLDGVAATDLELGFGDYGLLVVKDTGEGMEPHVLARVFEPFFTTKELGRGTGLGLATAYGVIRQAGGTVRVKSTPGVGTTFSVWLPVDSPDVSEKAGRGGSDCAPPDKERPPRILVVEDEAPVRRIVDRMLREAGYEVFLAHGGVEAIRIMERDPARVDLLFTDVRLPLITGPELVKKLRVLKPGLLVLYTSGNVGDLQVIPPEEANHTRYLPKPFGPDALLESVGHLLSLVKR